MEHTKLVRAVHATKSDPKHDVPSLFVDAYGTYDYLHYMKSAGGQALGLVKWSNTMTRALHSEPKDRITYDRILVINSQVEGNKILNGAKVEFLKDDDNTMDTKDSRGSILIEAQNVIYGDREKTYGHPGKNINLIASLWTHYMGVSITPDDVCMMMVLLKVARLKNDPIHRDSQVDIAGYTALMQRVQDYECQRDSNPAAQDKTSTEA